jgi:hypothetical protein
MEEAQDLHVDAMKVVAASLPTLAEARRERSRDVDADEVRRFDEGRRRLLSLIGRGAGGALVAGGLAAILAPPARADTPLDIRILQTASSLETLAVAAYGLALGEGPDGADAPAARALAGIAGTRARATLTAFAQETRRQHTEHRKAFHAQTTALGGKVQDAPNPKFLPMLAGADLGTPAKLVEFAATLEKVATDTYLLDLSMLGDRPSKAIMAGVMAVESQHLATLRAVGALLAGGNPQLVAVPLPTSELSKVPATVGSVAFPDALHVVGGPELVAEPASGAA